MDGLRFDRVAEIQPPVLGELAGAGGWGVSLLPYGVSPGAAFPVYTDSGPGWSTIATGVWPGKHGVTGNDFAGPQYSRYPDFLTRAKSERPELSTFAILSWDVLAHQGTFGAGIDARIVLDGERDGYRPCDEQAAELAVRLLTEEDPDAGFVYLGETDEVAHAVGPLGAEYEAALLRQDHHLGRLLEAIRGRATRRGERWTVLVTTDHGHLDEGGHGGDSTAERTVFVVCAELESKPDFVRDHARLVDIAPTVLHRLGVGIDAAWGLDGTPLAQPGVVARRGSVV